MSAPTTDPLALPSAADFLADAAARLETVALLLSPRRWEDIDPVAALRELSRATAAPPLLAAHVLSAATGIPMAALAATGASERAA